MEISKSRNKRTIPFLTAGELWKLDIMSVVSMACTLHNSTEQTNQLTDVLQFTSGLLYAEFSQI